MLETKYIEYTFSPLPDEAGRELLISELMVLGFDSFAEEDDRVTAYLPAALHTDDILSESGFIRQHPGLNVSVKQLEEKNWNEEWEKNYDPVVIGGRCLVRAPFHAPRPELPLEIVIEPKMSFGTAHHETTQLVAEWLLEQETAGKSVLDMGSGTGVLAILANKTGAAFVMGIDNDEWAWRNALENFSLNGVVNGAVLLGDAGAIAGRRFDLVLANINRNVLTGDMRQYAAAMNPNARIIFSGFLQEDEAVILRSAAGAGLSHLGTRTKGAWAAMLFMK